MQTINKVSQTHRVAIALILIVGVVYSSFGSDDLPSVHAQEAVTKTPSLDLTTSTPVPAIATSTSDPAQLRFEDFQSENISYLGMTFNYPSSWNLQPIPYRNFGFRISSPDIALDPIGNPLAGGYISATVFSETEAEWSDFLLRHPGEAINISGYDGVVLSYTELNRIEWHIYAFGRHHIIWIMHAEADEALIPMLSDVARNTTLTGVYTAMPQPELSKTELDALQLLDFPSLKQPFASGTGKIINDYDDNNWHTGGDLYAFDLCEGSECEESVIEDDIVIAPTNLTLVWSLKSNGQQTINDFHIFEITSNATFRLCTSLGHFRLTDANFKVGTTLPRGAQIGRIIDYKPNIEHIHIALHTVPISQGCAGSMRTPIPFDGNNGGWSLDGVDYPINTNHTGNSITSTNAPLCAVPREIGSPQDAKETSRAAAGCDAASSLYASSSSNLWRIDPYTETGTTISSTGYEITDIAFDGTTLYGVNFSQLLVINPTTGSRSIIGSIGYNDVNALTVAPDGTMYGATVSGKFLRINKSSGTGTLIGYYGAGLGSSGDLAIRDNIMYASVLRSGSNDWLAQININTGTATLIGDIGRRGVCGIDFKDGNLFGATCGGDLLHIDTSTGLSTYIKTFSASFGGLSTVVGDLPVPNPPGVATLVTPSGAITNNAPAYTWNKVNTSTWYYLWVSRVNTNGTLTTVHTKWYEASTVCGTSTCSVTPAGVTLSSGNYRWWIQTWNTSGYGPWSNALNFSISPVGPATLLSPNGSITDNTQTYTWNKINAATWYYLWVNGPGGNVFKQWFESSAVCGTSTCSVTPSVILSGGNHRWWVQTWNPGGHGPWSSAMDFSLPVVSSPGATALNSPSGNITNTTPTYTWAKVNAATWYYLWVNGPGGNVIRQWYEGATVCGASTCSVTPNITLGGGNHQWWVQTWNSGGYGPWSTGLSFSLPVTGFDSQFNGSTAGWTPRSGTWWNQESQWYTTTGVPYYWGTTSYTTSYSNFDYQARLYRNGCYWCSNTLIIRGTPLPLTTNLYRWDDAYIFNYTNGGSFSVWKWVNGVEYAVQNWTSTSAINQYSWNTIRVIANGSNFSFYINGTLVWTGTDTLLSNGLVGFGMYREEYADEQLWIDWATLNPTVSALDMSITGDTVSTEQQILNDAANADGSAGQTPEKHQP